MPKTDLLKALCMALNLETHGHHDVTGLHKRVKAKIRNTEEKRRGPGLARPRQLKAMRREIHRLKRMIHEPQFRDLTTAAST